jgi:hypothetical protein
MTTKSFTPWGEFDPIEYTWRSYGQTILPEDRQIIRAVITSLQRLGVAPGSLERVADVGSGPNFYPAMILAGLLKPGGSIELIEYAQPNRDFMSVLLGPGPHIYRNRDRQGRWQWIDTHQPWGKFDALIAEIGGEPFRDTFNRARACARSISGSIFELPRTVYDLVTSFFVIESISTEESECVRAVSASLGTLKEGGSFVVAVTVKAEGGYPAGEGTCFPTVNLSVSDCRRIFDSIPGIEYEVYLTTRTDQSDDEVAAITGKRIPASL